MIKQEPDKKLIEKVILLFNEKKYLEDRKKTWKKFIDLSIKGTIIIAIILILMAIFLTNP